jgi:23S rRNA maturation-related 3'-5' exoribonuclease YhaM
MRLRHKVNHGWSANRNDPEWERRVEREALSTTDATERAWKTAQRRLARAEIRRERVAKALNVNPRRLAIAEQIVELRREELQRIERLMTSHSAPAKNRGRKSHRPVPYADGGAI